jgi:hypothetical protein
LRNSSTASSCAAGWSPPAAVAFSKQNWNLTRQAQIYKLDQAEANRMAQAAGHRDALSARFANAK